MARFEFAQIAGHRVAYYPPLVKTIKQQLSRMKNHRSQYDVVSETSTGFNKGSGFCSPPTTLPFDFDFDSKNQIQKQTENSKHEATITTMSQDNLDAEKKIGEESFELEVCSRRILKVLGLHDAFLPAARAAVEAESKWSRSSPDGIVQRIWTAATLARRRGIENEEFLEDYLGQSCAREILESVNLPLNNNLIVRVAEVVKAEAKDTCLPLYDAARRITQAASDDRRRGMRVDIFYFEDMRWRSNAGTNEAEQRKLDNLEVNARVKQRIRERLRVS